MNQQPLHSGFGPASTTVDVLEDLDLHGKTAVVTGGYSGIGLETTRALAGAGARVLVPARRVDVAADALAAVDGVEVHPMDLADLASVRTFAESILQSGLAIDLMIASAGVMATPEQRVGNGWESQFAINHLGHFALVNHLAPALDRGRARIVSVSSAGHSLTGIRWDDVHFHTGYDRWLAYGQSKTANALFAVELHRRGLQAFSAHPGSILTPLQRHIPREEQIAMGWMDEHGTAGDGFKTPAQGAATSVWAATSRQLDDRGGQYLENCDIATLSDTDDAPVGVKPWAVDPDQGQRLWTMSAELTGVDVV